MPCTNIRKDINHKDTGLKGRWLAVLRKAAFEEIK
jgi:hypothetical protein